MIDHSNPTLENIMDEQIISQRLIPGITPDFIISEIEAIPLLHHHWKVNTTEHQKRLIDVMMRSPSKSDNPGFIYGFRKKEGYDSRLENYQIKMGRTKLDVPQDRIFQWEKDDRHEYVQIFTIRSESNMKLEALVHLLFAYARKTIIINGKRRIQWFQFKQKTATAAATNYLNLLMQKVHERNFQPIVKQVDIRLFNQMITRIISSCNFSREKTKIVTFGLPRTGKTTIGNIIYKIPMKVEKIENRLKLTADTQTTQVLRQLMQISPLKNAAIDSNEALQRYFISWHNLCNTESIVPILIVKQSDIESSMLIGLLEGVKLINQYLTIQESPIFVINRASASFNQFSPLEFYEDMKGYLSEVDLNQLKTLRPTIIREGIKEGSFSSQQESDNLYRQIQNVVSKKTKWGSIDLKLDSDLIKKCHQVIEMSYSQLQQLYAQKFLAKWVKTKQLEDQFNIIKYLKDKIKYLKEELNPSQRTVHEYFQKLSSFLNFEEKENLECLMYAFCQCVANKNLNNTVVFELITEKMNERESDLIYAQNQNLKNILENFKIKIINYIRKGNSKYLSILSSLIEEEDYELILAKLEEIVKSQCHLYKQALVIDVDADQIETIKKKKNAQRQQLVQAIEETLKFIKFLDSLTQNGFRFDNTKGRIKQTIYLGMNSQEQGYERAKVSPFKIVKQQTQEEKVQSRVTEKQKKQKISPRDAKAQIQKTEKIPSREQIQDSKSMKVLQNSDNVIIVKISKMSVISSSSQNLAQGKTIISIGNQEFIIDIDSHNIYHTTIIFAKTIKVYNNFTPSFKKIANFEEGKKLQFILVAQKFENMDKIKIPSTSRYGKVMMFTWIDKIFKPIDSYYSKYPEKLDKEFVKNLQAIYLSKNK